MNTSDYKELTMASTTFRTDVEKLQRIDASAKSLGRSRSWLSNKVVDDLLEHEEWFAAGVQKGIQDDSENR
jgi:predicted transcriptional regulator